MRGALIPASIVSALVVAVATLISGGPGFFAGILASVIVLIFFSVSLVVSALTKNADPITIFSMAMFSYFTKLMLVAGLLIAVTRLTDESAVDRRTFGIGALIISAAWLGGEIRAFLRLRLELEIPQSDGQKKSQSDGPTDSGRDSAKGGR